MTDLLEVALTAGEVLDLVLVPATWDHRSAPGRRPERPARGQEEPRAAIRRRLALGAARFPWTARRRGKRDHDRLMLRLLDADDREGWRAALDAHDGAALERLLHPPPEGRRRRAYLAGMEAANRRLARWARRHLH